MWAIYGPTAEDGSWTVAPKRYGGDEELAQATIVRGRERAVLYAVTHAPPGTVIHVCLGAVTWKRAQYVRIVVEQTTTYHA